VISVRVRQIYYDSKQLGLLEPLWKPYLNTTLTPYFENEVIRELYLASDHIDSDYYGVFSWKFRAKHRKDCNYVERKAHGDVCTFFGKYQGGHKNTFLDTYHPNLLRIGQLIVTKLFNKNILDIEADRFYYNHWLAKSEVFDGYCKEMLLPAMGLMENDPVIKELVNQDAEYRDDMMSGSSEDLSIMKPDRCMEVFGKPYYTHHAFVLERLPAIYFAIKGYKVNHI